MMNEHDEQFDEGQGDPSAELPTELRQLFAAARRDVAPVLDVTAQVRERIAQRAPAMLAAVRNLASADAAREPWAEFRSWPVLAVTTLATLAASIAAVMCVREANALFDPMAGVLQSLTMVLQ